MEITKAMIDRNPIAEYLKENLRVQVVSRSVGFTPVIEVKLVLENQTISSDMVEVNE